MKIAECAWSLIFIEENAFPIFENLNKFDKQIVGGLEGLAEQT